MPLIPVTTSWDDGHPADFRIADLLLKYGLKGTFYIPRVCETLTMDESGIRQLASVHEIGAHTVNHVYLTEVDDATADREIIDSKAWIESVIGAECRMFCFPRGKFRPNHLDTAAKAGYTGVRTTEMLSTYRPKMTRGVRQLPTTIEALQQSHLAFTRNIVKRRSVPNLLNLLRTRGQIDWTVLARTLLPQAIADNGVYHLWGHSWEIEEHDLWKPLEELFKFLQEHSEPSQRMTNAGVCDALAAA